MPRRALKAKNELCPRLDVYYLRRQGLLAPGRISTLTWSWANAQRVALSAQLTVQDDHLVVGIRPRQVVMLTTTPCHYGGQRHWLVCPACDGRAAILHLRGTSFLCRACGLVAYASQSEDRIARAWRQQEKVERRIGTFGAPKPKGMHWATFERLRQERLHWDMVRDELLVEVGRRRFPSFFGGPADAQSAKPQAAARTCNADAPLSASPSTS